MAEDLGLNLLRVGDLERAARSHQFALVADLAAGLGIERRGIQHHDGLLSRSDLLHGSSVDVDSRHAALADMPLVTGKARLAALVLDTQTGLELARGTRLLALTGHRRLETGHVQVDAAFACDVRRQVHGETEGVVYLAHRFAVKHPVLEM